MMAGTFPYNKLKFMIDKGYPVPFHINDTITAKLYILKDLNICNIVIMDKSGLEELSDSKPIISKKSGGINI